MNSDRLRDEKFADVWSRWLDGETVSEIVRWGPIENLRLVKQILDMDPHQIVAGDPRLEHEGRFLWISLTVAPDDARDTAFVVVKSPRRYTAAAFQKAVRAIRREVKEHGGELNPFVLEGADGIDGAEALIRMVTTRG